MEVKKIVEGMTAVEVAEVIDSNFKGLNVEKANKEETDAKLSELSSELGKTTTISLSPSNYIGLMWNGSSFQSSASTGYNAFAVKLRVDFNYSFSGTKNTIIITDGYPVVGGTGFEVNGVYKCEREGLYAVITQQTSIGAFIVKETKSDGLIQRVSYIENNYIPKDKPQFVNNASIDNCIEELYIPNISSLENFKLWTFEMKNNNYRLFFTTNGQYSHLAAEGGGVNSYFSPSVFDLKPIIPIISSATSETIGWVVLKYISDISTDVGGVINKDIVADINNSPTIKTMLMAKDQVVLLGDSIFGQPSTNILPFVMQGVLKKRVYQLGFGGCTMAARPSEENSGYDRFGFVSIADAVVNKNYTNQENKASSLGYNYQISELKSIDWSKKTTILCNYVNNDISVGIDIGNYYNSETEIESLNKTSFLGAQTYGVRKIIEKYKNTNIIFLGAVFRKIDGLFVTEYTNSKGLSVYDYIEAESVNSKKMGIRFVDMLDYGKRNIGNLDASTTDGTHFNGVGAEDFAKYLCAILSSYDISFVV